MNIEVGEYIRTKGGIIGKVQYVREGYKYRTNTGHVATGQESYLLDNKKQRGSISKPYITKHSKNIIDLIEVGDIVKIGVDTIFSNVFETQENLDYFKELYKNDTDAIISIITKEQRKDMEYRL